jgi:ferric-dicitrate binding protein FerR (iron transport regulator)
MRRSRLRRLIAAYGADASRWPEAERRAAARMAAADPSARAALADAGRLDELLDCAAPTPAAGPLEIAVLPAQRRSACGMLVRWVGSAAAGRLGPALSIFAAASVVGVLIGTSSLADRVVGAQETEGMAGIFDGAPEDWAP